MTQFTPELALHLTAQYRKYDEAKITSTESWDHFHLEMLVAIGHLLGVEYAETDEQMDEVIEDAGERLTNQLLELERLGGGSLLDPYKFFSEVELA